MLNFLRRLFKSQDKDVLVSDLTHTPAANFELDVMTKIQQGVSEVWVQTAYIDVLSEEISHLMEARQKCVQERSELVAAINKQRKVLDLEEIDEEGVCISSHDPADDENYALES